MVYNTNAVRCQESLNILLFVNGGTIMTQMDQDNPLSLVIKPFLFHNRVLIESVQ